MGGRRPRLRQPSLLVGATRQDAKLKSLIRDLIVSHATSLASADGLAVMAAPPPHPFSTVPEWPEGRPPQRTSSRAVGVPSGGRAQPLPRQRPAPDVGLNGRPRLAHGHVSILRLARGRSSLRWPRLPRPPLRLRRPRPRPSPPAPATVNSASRLWPRPLSSSQSRGPTATTREVLLRRHSTRFPDHRRRTAVQRRRRALPARGRRRTRPRPPRPPRIPRHADPPRRDRARDRSALSSQHTPLRNLSQ